MHACAQANRYVWQETVHACMLRMQRLDSCERTTAGDLLLHFMGLLAKSMLVLGPPDLVHTCIPCES